MIYVFPCALLLLAAAVVWAWFNSPARPRRRNQHGDPELERIEQAKQRAMRAMTAERLLAEAQLQRFLQGGLAGSAGPRGAADLDN
jgi:hypothetical protein